MKQQITAAREKAAQAVKAARALGTKITETQAAGQPVGELETQFEQAHKESAAALKELNRLEQLDQLETQDRELNDASTRLRSRETESIEGVIRETVATERQLRAGGDVREEFRLRRRERQDREFMAREIEMHAQRFRSAGVTNVKEYQKFRGAHEQAYRGYIVGGNAGAMAAFEAQGFRPAEAFALVTTSGELGGFLVPEENSSEILRDLAGFAAMRPICRVERVGSSALVFPTIQSAGANANIYATGYTGAWKPEGYLTGGANPTVQNQPKFGNSRVVVHAWAPDASELSMELLNDSRADVEGIVNEVIAETRAIDEDAAFTNGSGVDRPFGIMATHADVVLAEIKSGDANLLTYGGLIDMFTGLPAQYRKGARWMFSSLTWGDVLKLKDTTNQPLFPVNAPLEQLLGKPITINEWMPTVAANAFPIVFGDFRYYGIADREELRVQRLVEKFAPNVGLLASARLGGKTLRQAAFRKQKVAA